MNIIRWENPVTHLPDTTDKRGARRDWSNVAEMLIIQPGRWALISETEPNHSLTQAINRGKIRVFTKEKFEAVSTRYGASIHVHARRKP